MNQVSKLEKGSFLFGVLSQNLVFAFVSSYIMIFYTDYIGISSLTVGTIFFVARIWDAVNDPMMGIICDKTRSRYGRFRPYLLLVSLPIVVIMFFLFSENMIFDKVAYAYLTYILFGMIYTVSDIPLWSLTSCMSSDSKERTRIISMGKAIAPVAFILVSVLTMPMIQAFGDGISAYKKVGLIYACIMMIGMLFMFFFTKERVSASKERLSIREILGALIINKPLLLILSSQIFILVVDNLIMAVGIYYAKYNLKDAGLVPVMSLVIIIPLILSIFISTKLAEGMDKKTLMIGFMVLRVMGYVFVFLVGYESHLLFFLALGLVSLTAGSAEVLLPAMMVETIDYIQLKTGKRPEGIMWSTQTFIVKAGSSLSGILLGYLLVVVDFEPNVIQSTSTLNGIHMILSLLPALLIGLSIVPMLFYPLTKKKYQKIVEELEMKKAI